MVFDRIRENIVKTEIAFSELLNLSISQTMSRTIMTSLTTLLALLALFIFGGEVVRGFVSAMIWGVLDRDLFFNFYCISVNCAFRFSDYKENQ